MVFEPLADLGSIFFDLDYSESECALVTDWVGANAASMSHVDFGIFVRLFEYIKSTATEAESRRFDVFQKTPDFLVCSEARNRGDAAGLASSTVYEIYASASSSRLYVLLCDGTVQVWGAFGECLMRNIPIVVSASENEENRRDSTLFAIEMLYGASGADRRANSGRSSGSSVMQIHERCGLVTVNTTCMDALIRFHDSQSFRLLSTVSITATGKDAIVEDYAYVDTFESLICSIRHNPKVLVFSSITGECIADMRGHRGKAPRLIYVDTMSHLVTGGRGDSLIRVWNVGEQIIGRLAAVDDVGFNHRKARHVLLSLRELLIHRNLAEAHIMAVDRNDESVSVKYEATSRVENLPFGEALYYQSRRRNAVDPIEGSTMYVMNRGVSAAEVLFVSTDSTYVCVEFMDGTKDHSVDIDRIMDPHLEDVGDICVGAIVHVRRHDSIAQLFSAMNRRKDASGHITLRTFMSAICEELALALPKADVEHLFNAYTSPESGGHLALDSQSFRNALLSCASHAQISIGIENDAEAFVDQIRRQIKRRANMLGVGREHLIRSAAATPVISADALRAWILNILQIGFSDAEWEGAFNLVSGHGGSHIHISDLVQYLLAQDPAHIFDGAKQLQRIHVACRAVLKGHDSFITSLVYLPVSMLIVSASLDGTLIFGTQLPKIIH